MLKNVKCARCVKCGKEYEAVPNLTNCECGGILDIIYDYDYIKANLTKEKLKSRPNTMWRYRELLPVEETTPDTPLRVGWSPLYEEPRLAKQLGLKKLWVKDDGQNPTASLKDRASAMAVAKAGEAGAKIIACSSTGNAASSLAGNAAAAGGELVADGVLEVIADVALAHGAALGEGHIGLDGLGLGGGGHAEVDHADLGTVAVSDDDLVALRDQIDDGLCGLGDEGELLVGGVAQRVAAQGDHDFSHNTFLLFIG